jgi:AcrR family transcriptional regulator
MPDVTSMFWPDESRSKRGPKPRLTLDGIVEAAIALADAEGLAAVSMQRIAVQLGATKMSLYRYVPAKAELTALMLDTAIGPPPTEIGRARTWRTGLVAWAMALRHCFARRPWGLELAVGARVLGPNELAWLEAGLSHLASTPLRAAERLDVLALLSGHIRGIVHQQGAGTETERQTGKLMERVLSAHAEQYPAAAAAFAEAASSAGRDNALAFGLDRILDGVAALIDRRSAR